MRGAPVGPDLYDLGYAPVDSAANYVRIVECPGLAHCWHSAEPTEIDATPVPTSACCWCGLVRYLYHEQHVLADPRPHGAKLMHVAAAPAWFWTRCAPYDTSVQGTVIGSADARAAADVLACLRSQTGPRL